MLPISNDVNTITYIFNIDMIRYFDNLSLRSLTRLFDSKFLSLPRWIQNYNHSIDLFSKYENMYEQRRVTKLQNQIRPSLLPADEDFSTDLDILNKKVLYGTDISK